MGEGYKDLRVWQEAMLLAKEVYAVTRQFPKEEMYGLAQQARRSAVSIASNIAEGSARNSSTEFGQFLGIAAGSLAELNTQLLIAADVFIGTEKSMSSLLARADDIGKMLTGLRKKMYEKRTTKNEQRVSYAA